MSAIGFNQKDMLISSVLTVPPWLLNCLSADLTLSNFDKSETDIFESKFQEICDNLKVFITYIIYTNGSKTNYGTAAVNSLRITSHTSIFTAELKPALDIIR